MAIRIQFDNTNNAIEPTLILATKGGDRLGALKPHNVQVIDSTATSEILFSVYKYENGIETPQWESVQDFKLVYCPEMDMWFEIRVELNVEDATVKHVSAISLGEAELSQLNLYGIEINTETDILRDDYKPTVLFNETTPEASLLNRIMEKAPHYTIVHVDASIAKIQRTFQFDGTTIYDAFQEIAQEIDCIFIINSGMNEDGGIAREISVYDLESHCKKCGARGNFLNTCSECGSENISTGYGEDTSIFVCVDNLADGITYSTDVDSVKNCFRLVGGDDLMTATIANCNPNGSSYLWYLTDELRADMSGALRSRLQQYDETYEVYQTSHPINLDSTILQKYNALIDKYIEYKSDLRKIANPVVGYPALMEAYYDVIDFHMLLAHELMPPFEKRDTTASEQAALLTSSSLSPVAVTNLAICSSETATNAVLAMARILVDKRYRVKASDGALSGSIWTGTFTVTNYADETDISYTPVVRVTISDDYAAFVEQKLEKALDNSTEDDMADITALFKMTLGNFKVAIKGYGLARLSSISNACQACLDIMIEQGIANNETWKNQSPSLYESMYLPYYQKHIALQEEMVLRESEIAIVAGKYNAVGDLVSDGMQTNIIRESTAIRNALNFEKYLGESLWKEFAAYRREDTYQNSNYISDGLNNDELFANALAFIETAKKEIFKSATLQHSITATMKNLLVMREFAPIVDHFQVGNWIRIQVDDSVYRLRLLSYEISYGELDEISVVFSDVTRVVGGATDSESILNQAASMATSYDNIMHQAEQSAKTKDQLDSWVTDGLALTKMKIIDKAVDQNVIFDEHGLLCRQYLPITEAYDDKQLKIINRGLYLTDDNWMTSRAGIGDFVYFNPETGLMEEAYGVIADTLIGNLILSKEVGIYNTDSSIVMDESGIVMTTNGANIGGDQKVFTIRRKDHDDNGIETMTNLLYVDNDGNLTFAGMLKGASGEFTGRVTATELIISSDGKESGIDEYISNNSSFQQLENQIGSAVASIDVEYCLSDSVDTPPDEDDAGWNTDAPEWEEGRYMWQRTRTEYANGDSALSKPVCIAGAAGEDGVGVAELYEEYALSSSASVAPTVGWSKDSPTWESGKYIWTRIRIVYTNGEEQYTDPVLSAMWSAIEQLRTETNTSFKVLQDGIEAKVDSETFNALDERVSANSMQITQTATQLESVAQSITALDGEVQKNSVAIQQTADRLEAVAEQIASGGDQIIAEMADGSKTLSSSYASITSINLQNVGIVAGDQVTWSVYVKPSVQKNVGLNVYYGAGHDYYSETVLIAANTEQLLEYTTEVPDGVESIGLFFHDQNSTTTSTSATITYRDSVLKIKGSSDYVTRSEFEMTAQDIRLQVSAKLDADDPAKAVNNQSGVVINAQGVYVTGGEISLSTSDGEEYVNISGDGVSGSSMSAPNVAVRYDGPNTIYVNQNGTTGDGVYRSVASALKALNNKVVESDIVISISSNHTEYGVLYIEGMSGAGNITVSGDSQRTATINGQLIVRSNANRVNIVNMTFTAGGTKDTSFALINAGGGEVSIQNSVFKSIGGIGVVTQLGRVAVGGCEFYGQDISMLSRDGGLISAYNNKGTANMDNWSGILIANGTAPSTSTSVYVPGGASFVTCYVDQGSGTTTPSTGTASTTVQYQLLHSDYYAGGWSFTSDNDLRQGYMSGRQLYGCMWFSSMSGLSGRSIKDATLRLHRDGAYGRSGSVSVYLRGLTTAYSSSMSSPSLSGDYGLIGTINPGETIEFAIPTAAITALANGTIKGLALYTGETAYYKTYQYSKNYARFDGETSGTDDTKPRLTVTYT